jgi:hypothetical protein
MENQIMEVENPEISQETEVVEETTETGNEEVAEETKNIVFLKHELIDVKQELTKEDHLEALKKLQELQNEKNAIESELEQIKQDKKNLEKDFELKDKMQKEYISDANKAYVFRTMSIDLYADFDENKLKWLDHNGNMKKEEEGIPDNYKQMSMDNKVKDEEEYAHGFTKSELVLWWENILHNFEENTVDGLMIDDANLVELKCYDDASYCNIIRNHQNNPHNQKPTIQKQFYKNAITRIKEIYDKFNNNEE